MRLSAREWRWGLSLAHRSGRAVADNVTYFDSNYFERHSGGFRLATRCGCFGAVGPRAKCLGRRESDIEGHQ